MIDQDEKQEERNQKKQKVLNYCDASGCNGVEMELDAPEEPITDCLICLESFESSRFAFLPHCRHYVCLNCVSSLTQCPLCRAVIPRIIQFNKAVLPKMDRVDIKAHLQCMLSGSPNVKEYLSHVSQLWKDFAEFLFLTRADKRSFSGVKGLEHLNLTKIDESGRMIEKSEWHAAYTTEEGHIRVVFAVYLPNLSIRYVISEHDTFNFEVNNETADYVLDCLLKQLKICWRMVPFMVNPYELSRLFVRKFEKVTCTLLIMGRNDCGTAINLHFTPMEEELSTMVPRNFDSAHINEAYKVMPSLLLTNLSVDLKYVRPTYLQCCLQTCECCLQTCECC